MELTLLIRYYGTNKGSLTNASRELGVPESYKLKQQVTVVSTSEAAETIIRYDSIHTYLLSSSQNLYTGRGCIRKWIVFTEFRGLPFMDTSPVEHSVLHMTCVCCPEPFALLIMSEKTIARWNAIPLNREEGPPAPNTLKVLT